MLYTDVKNVPFIFLSSVYKVGVKYLHHNRPMTMTSTTSPLCSSTYCSVLGGSISRPLALRIDISLLDTWLPGQIRTEYLCVTLCLQCLHKIKNSQINSLQNGYGKIGEHVCIYLCFVPRAAALGDARWECSGGILVWDPVSHHRKAAVLDPYLIYRFSFP